MPNMIKRNSKWLFGVISLKRIENCILRTVPIQTEIFVISESLLLYYLVQAVHNDNYELNKLWTEHCTLPQIIFYRLWLLKNVFLQTKVRAALFSSIWNVSLWIGNFLSCGILDVKHFTVMILYITVQFLSLLLLYWHVLNLQ